MTPRRKMDRGGRTKVLKLTRHELADAIAIDRAEYEIQYASYGESAWQPMIPFVKSVAFQIAKRTPVAGITVTRSEYGDTFYARVDWKKLADLVERRVPRTKATIEMMNREQS